MVHFKEIFSNILTELTITIERISIKDNKNAFKNFKLIPIQNSAFFYFDMKISKNPLMLPKLYAALTCLAGPSDNSYDHFKGSYSFTFKLEVNKNNNISQYYYHIYHYRSYIEFSICHITSNSDPREEIIYHQPDDKLFSNDDICYFSNYFCHYALGYAKGFKYKPIPFVKYSNSNLLLFGYLDGKYFFKEYNDEIEYQKRQYILIKQLNAQDQRILNRLF